MYINTKSIKYNNPYDILSVKNIIFFIIVVTLNCLKLILVKNAPLKVIDVKSKLKSMKITY
jgi:hypothetical protein